MCVCVCVCVCVFYTFDKTVPEKKKLDVHINVYFVGFFWLPVSIYLTSISYGRSNRWKACKGI